MQTSAYTGNQGNYMQTSAYNSSSATTQKIKYNKKNNYLSFSRR